VNYRNQNVRQEKSAFAPTIAVVLNAFKRGATLEQQFDAVRMQSAPPSEVLIWQNERHFEIPPRLVQKTTIGQSNRNLGVWARLAFALNARAEFICVLDDDTIPGARWFENCLTTMSTHEGLLGARGLRFKSRRTYMNAEDVGWGHPNDEVEKVDIVGHAWFFRREWLSTFWLEQPPPDFDSRVGEDMHFSYTLSKYLGLNTYVPPHPVGCLDLWGSLPEFGNLYGSSEVGISSELDSQKRFDQAYRFYVGRGLNLTLPRSRKNDLHAAFLSMIFNVRLRSLIRNFPKLRNAIRRLRRTSKVR
jgi:hypothetical protein